MRLNEVVISGTRKLNLSSINLFNKKPMNTQLTIVDNVMQNGHSSTYYFTPMNHFSIINMFERCRIKHNLTENQFAKIANYSRSCYMQKVKGQHRFSRTSFLRFYNLCDKLERDNNKDNQPLPVYEVTQPLPVYKTTPSNNVELTEDICIRFLKATGLYKISKSEVTTNWIEL